MELLQGPDLCTLMMEGLIERKEELIRKVLTGVVCGLNYLHGKQIVHCDIKLDNIMFTDTTCTHIKILDFGQS